MKLGYGISIVALAVAQTAHAEEPPSRLDDIIVTADRAGFGADLVQVGTFRGARLIDVPLTVNVVSSEVLRAQAAAGLYDALRNTAGVSRSQLSGITYDNVAIRGILVENRTSYRLNGSLPVVNLVDLPIENKDRVEVLKGVGALYYGFAPPSGIVNLVTKRADRDVTELSASAGLYGAFGGSVDLGRRLGERLGVRINLAGGRLRPGIDRTDGSRYVAALAADWAITGTLKLNLDVEHIAKDVTETPAIVLLPAVAGRVALPPIPRPRSNLGARELRYDAHATNAMARLDWKIAPSVALTVEGGQAITVRDRDFSQFGGYNLTTGEGVLQLFRTRDQRYRNRNLRAELAAAFPTGPITHNLIVGATSNWRFQNGRSSATTPATAVAGSIAQNLFAPRALVIAPLTAALTVAPLNVRDRGLYVVDRAVLGPVQLLGGLRYSDYRSRATNVAGVTTDFKLSRATPSVGLIFKPSAKTSVYATYLEGLEEGGTAPANTANANEVLPPAVSTQYELGFKAELLRAVTLQIAAFEVSRPSAFTDPTDNRFKLAGQSRYRGVEASATGEVTADLSLSASLQYLDATIQRSNNALLLGRRPENTPKYTASLFVEYRPVVGLAVGAGAFHVGARPVNNFNQAFIDGYTTVSASMRYTFSDIGKGLTLQLNADNLANARYWSAAGNGLLGVGLPRQVKLTARIGL